MTKLRKPEWVIIKRYPQRMSDQEVKLHVEKFLLDKEVLDRIDGPVIQFDIKRNSIIKLACSSSHAKMLCKCPGVLRLEGTGNHGLQETYVPTRQERSRERRMFNY